MQILLRQTEPDSNRYNAGDNPAGREIHDPSGRGAGPVRGRRAAAAAATQEARAERAETPARQARRVRGQSTLRTLLPYIRYT